MIEALSVERVRLALGSRLPPVPSPLGQALTLECVSRTGSTNADLLARLPTLHGPHLLAAEEQTAGRGRAGRHWSSAAHASLTFSLAWPFARPLSGLLGLPLAVGVALADALRGLGVHAQLKWPNDVLLDGEKLAGVLVETGRVTGMQSATRSMDPSHHPSQAQSHQQPQGQPQVQTWAVIGVGLNLALPPATLPRQAAHASQLLHRRNDVLAALVAALMQAMKAFDQTGFGPFSASWNALHAWRDRPVLLQEGPRVLASGTALGVDEEGCLLLQTAHAIERVMVGDVSLREDSAHA